MQSVYMYHSIVKDVDELRERLLSVCCELDCVDFGQKWKTGTGRHYFTDIIRPSSTTVI